MDLELPYIAGFFDGEGSVREGTKDLVEIPHALWQIVNFEHH